MSHEYYRRGRNWFTAIGTLFSVMAGIVLVRQLLIWGPEFVEEFCLMQKLLMKKFQWQC